jgi:hypothetical protein
MIRHTIEMLLVAFGLVHLPELSSVLTEAEEWELYELEAYAEYADEFTALFNSYEVKFSKNGRTMIRQGDSGSFKFAKKG